MKTLHIQTTTDLEHRTLMAILYSFKYKHSEYNSSNTWEDAHYKYKKYKSTVVYTSDKRMAGNYLLNSGLGQDEIAFTFSTDLNKIYDTLKEGKEITINNVGDYNAKVSDKEVLVGCQTISHEKVEEIYNAIQKLKNS